MIEAILAREAEVAVPKMRDVRMACHNQSINMLSNSGRVVSLLLAGTVKAFGGISNNRCDVEFKNKSTEGQVTVQVGR